MDKTEALTFPELLETVPQDSYLNILNIQHETEPEVRIIPVGRYCHNAAAELRRLHHTVAAREDDIQTHSAAVYEAIRLLAQAREQRDALLEALKWIADHDLVDTDLMIAGHMAHGFIGRARAAIAKVEEGK